MNVIKFNTRLHLQVFNYIIFLILLAILLTGFSVTLRAKDSTVTVFILDTALDYNFIKHGAMTDGRKVSHGSIVGRIISEEAPAVNLRSLAIDDNKDSTGEDPYLSGLKTVFNYKQKHPHEEVLLNISLAFQRYENKHHDLIDQLHKAGVIIIAAAGNDNSEKPVFPAGFKEVVAVANAGKKGKAPSSNYGEYIDISAEGNIEFITSLYLPTGIGYHTLKAEGTSFAAPRVTGLLAKILNIKPDLSPEKALELIKEAADPIADSMFAQKKLGSGTINVSRALSKVKPYYQIKKIMYSLVIILSLLVIGLLLIRKYGLASIFITLLILLVVLPLSLALGNQLIPVLTYLYCSLDQFNLNFYDFIIIVGNIVLILIFTGWEHRFLLMIYTIMTTGFFITYNYMNFNSVIGKTYLLLLYSITALSLFFYEKLFIKIINKKVNDSLLLIKHINSYSTKISNTACNKMISAENNSVNNNDDIEEIIFNHLRQTSRKNVGINLLKLLIYSNNPPVKQLITFALNHRSYNDPLENLFIGRGDDMIIPLFKVLTDSDYDKRKMAAEILKGLNSERVISVIENNLEQDQGIDKVILLEILASYGKQASHLTEKLKDIIFQYSDMWFRYQALKTLIAIHPRPEKLYSLLYKLTSDHQELIRLEAKGIIKDMEEEKGGGY